MLVYLLAAMAQPKATRPPEPEDLKSIVAEIASLTRLSPGFRTVTLPKSGQLTLAKGQSFTVEAVRGKTLDSSPPELGELVQPYPANQTDTFVEGEAPYEAKGIKPFWLKHFACEFNYGGHHNLKMHEYASTHGFSVIFPYTRTKEQRSRLPKGTRWLNWGGFVDFDKWLPQKGIPAGRYDKIGSLDIESELIKEGFLKDLDPDDWHMFMIDIEHHLYQREDLRRQDWYPKSGSERERVEFEKAYYQGYVKTITSPPAVAKRLGFKNLSIYGWSPFPASWWGLEKLEFKPATYPTWIDYGRAIHDHPAIDLLNPSLYVYYWSPQNVANMLLNLDLNRDLAAQSSKPKPLIPYTWPLLHGGDANHCWWKFQAVPTEEARAWSFMLLMGGVAGFDVWNWSDVGNHHLPRPWMTVLNGQETGSEFSIKSRLACKEESSDKMAVLDRYDFIKVLDYNKEKGLVRFQKIIKDRPSRYGVGPEYPVYAMDEPKLRGAVRADSEPISGVVEGLAMAKPIEQFLRRSIPVHDVSSHKQFHETLPIVRRCRLGPYSLIATYDPAAVYDGRERPVTLQDFDGRKGLTLVLPADRTVRYWILKQVVN